MNIPFRKSSRQAALSEQLEELTRYSELKRMAYNVAALQKQKRFRSLAVLSSLAAEGKTLFCAALAIAYAETCRTKVLVVDATTWQNPKSLVLKDCFDGPSPLIDFVSLKDVRQRIAHAEPVSKDVIARSIVLETEVVDATDMIVRTTEESDQSLLRKVTENGAQEYGLILLDTSAMDAKNKNNIDPLLVAHLSDASVLVVSRKLLNAAALDDYAKVLRDPNLHLIGMVSNEECSV